MTFFMPSPRSEQRHYVFGLSIRPAVRPVYTASFGYYANMVQQIEFIIYTNVQPLRQKFFTKGQGHRSSSKIQKNVLLR